MQSVMHSSSFRTLCHDDIRAIRKIYELSVKRDNAQYDDTCRRDFPMNKLQKLMYQIGRIITFSFVISSILSTMTCVLTLVYLLIRYLRRSQPNRFKKQSSTISTNSWLIKDNKAIIGTKHNVKHHGYIWHDEIL
jgi:hypothetical protein